jgi:hypothetical protein
LILLQGKWWHQEWWRSQPDFHNNLQSLQHNVLLGKGMDLNFFTWLLVTYVFFRIYTTPSLIQLACNCGNVTTWHPNQIHLPIFNTLHKFTLSVGGEEVPCNLAQIVSDTVGNTSTSGETITTFYKFAQLDCGEPNTLSSLNKLSNSIPCVFNYPFVMGN